MQYGFAKAFPVKPIPVGTHMLIYLRSFFSNIIITCASEYIFTKPTTNRNVPNLIRDWTDYCYPFHPEPPVLFAKHCISSIYHTS